mmetsp:Transcript_17689/g.53698  ORF Transcript_17689/g.53698 Transcript_17689/m.53698 type:complete len:187 (+) Transcript_17689:515-1075(+)
MAQPDESLDAPSSSGPLRPLPSRRLSFFRALLFAAPGPSPGLGATGSSRGRRWWISVSCLTALTVLDEGARALWRAPPPALALAEGGDLGGASPPEGRKHGELVGVDPGEANGGAAALKAGDDAGDVDVGVPGALVGALDGALSCAPSANGTPTAGNSGQGPRRPAASATNDCTHSMQHCAIMSGL